MEPDIHIGQPAQLQLPQDQSGERHPGSIADLTEDSITVAYPGGAGAVNGLACGDEVTLWIDSQGISEAIRTVVASKAGTTEPLLVLQRRKFLRIQVDIRPDFALLSPLSRLDSDGREIAPAEPVDLTISNISAGGMFFTSERSVQPGDRLEVGFTLGPRLSLSGIVEVVHTTSRPSGNPPLNGAGARFVDLDDETRLKLIDYILKKEQQAQADELWHQYRLTDDPRLREQLILLYIPLVKFGIRRLSIGLPAALDSEDLFGHGITGLLDAIERFDPTRGVRFETYALLRIQGSILDTLRELNMMPRKTGQQKRAIQNAIAQLTEEGGHTPTHVEVANRLGFDIDKYEQALQDIHVRLVSLDALLVPDNGNETYSLLDTLQDTLFTRPDDALDNVEGKRLLVDAVKSLPHRQRMVVSLRYLDRLTLKEIGKVLLLSESRICQLHARAIDALRRSLASSLV